MEICVAYKDMMSSLLLMLRAHLPSTQGRLLTNGWLRLAVSCSTGQLLLGSFTETDAEDVAGFGTIWRDHIPGYSCLMQSYEGAVENKN